MTDRADEARILSMRRQIEDVVTREYDATPTWVLYPRWALHGVDPEVVRAASRDVDIQMETWRRFDLWRAREGL